MTTYVNVSPQAAGMPHRVAAWARRLAEGLAWGRDMHQLCIRTAAAGRRLDHETLGRLAAEVVAAGRSR